MVSIILLRSAAAACAVLGLLEFAFGIRAFNVVSAPWGAWWAGLMLFLTSLTGCFPTTNSRMGVAMGFSIPAVIMLIAGLALDGLGYSFVNQLHGCVDRNLDFTGDDQYYLTAVACLASYDGDCACVEQTVAQNSDANCYMFDLRSADSCAAIIDDLPSLLQPSYFTCLVALIVAIIFSILTCSGVCCKPKEDSILAQTTLSNPLNAQTGTVIAVHAIPVYATNDTTTTSKAYDSRYGDNTA